MKLRFIQSGTLIFLINIFPSSSPFRDEKKHLSWYKTKLSCNWGTSVAIVQKDFYKTKLKL